MVECGDLENRYTWKGVEGSNPLYEFMIIVEDGGITFELYLGKILFQKIGNSSYVITSVIKTRRYEHKQV